MDNQKGINDPHTFFETELQKAKLAETIAQKRFNMLAIGRITAFLSIFGTAWFWNNTGQSTWGIGTAIAFILFLALMRLQQAAKIKRNFQRNLQTINEDEIERLSFRFKRKDTGIHFQEKIIRSPLIWISSEITHCIDYSTGQERPKEAADLQTGLNTMLRWKKF